MHTQLINTDFAKKYGQYGYKTNTLVFPKTFTGNCVNVFNQY
jgi:hypothetical protein